MNELHYYSHHVQKLRFAINIIDMLSENSEKNSEKLHSIRPCHLCAILISATFVI